MAWAECHTCSELQELLQRGACHSTGKGQFNRKDVFESSSYGISACIALPTCWPAVDNKPWQRGAWDFSPAARDPSFFPGAAPQGGHATPCRRQEGRGSAALLLSSLPASPGAHRPPLRQLRRRCGKDGGCCWLQRLLAKCVFMLRLNCTARQEKSVLLRSPHSL